MRTDRVDGAGVQNDACAATDVKGLPRPGTGLATLNLLEPPIAKESAGTDTFDLVACLAERDGDYVSDGAVHRSLPGTRGFRRFRCSAGTGVQSY
jgi:hypothetical protein